MFPNAYEGVKKIYIAEILSLVATILLLIGAVIGTTGLRVGEDTSSGEGLLVGGGLLIIIASLLMLIATIINIIGVVRASKDESAFKNALYALLFGIAASILMSAFSNNTTVSNISKTLSNVVEILTSYLICTGVINLAERLNNGEVSERGRQIRSILMGAWITAAVLNLLTLLFASNDTMQTVINIIAIVGSVISVVAYFFYIGLLGKAKKMLEP